MGPALLLAPYLPISDVTAVGTWDVMPFRHLFEADGDALRDARVPENARIGVLRLVQAYSVCRMGALAVPQGADIGSPFGRPEMKQLAHALLAGAIADNPPIAVSQDEQSPNGGHSLMTSENAIVYGQPITDGSSYAIETGMIARVADLRYANADEPLPKVSPPMELPTPLFANFDAEVANAAFATLADPATAGRRLHRALDWYRIAFSNAVAITPDVRVGAARSAIEALTGLSDETKKVVRAYGKLMRTTSTSEATYDNIVWARGPVQLTPDEYWLSRLTQLRNAIVHGDTIPDELWQHEGHHQLDQIHDRLIRCLKQTVSAHVGDELLCLRMGDRVFPRITEEILAARRAGREHGGAP